MHHFIFILFIFTSSVIKFSVCFDGPKSAFWVEDDDQDSGEHSSEEHSIFSPYHPTRDYESYASYGNPNPYHSLRPHVNPSQYYPSEDYGNVYSHPSMRHHGNHGNPSQYYSSEDYENHEEYPESFEPSPSFHPRLQSNRRMTTVNRNSKKKRTESQVLDTLREFLTSRKKTKTKSSGKAKKIPPSPLLSPSSPESLTDDSDEAPVAISTFNGKGPLTLNVSTACKAKAGHKHGIPLGECGQDAYFPKILSPNEIKSQNHLSYLVVSDGVSSHDNSFHVSQGILDQMKAFMNGTNSITKVLNDGFEQLKRIRLGNLKAATSTIIAASFDHFTGVLNTSSIGDCSLIVVRNGKRVFQTTIKEFKVNSPYQIGFDKKGNIEEIKSSSYNKEVQETFKTQPGDIIVSGSDGLFDNPLPEELVSFVKLFTRSILEEMNKNGPIKNENYQKKINERLKTIVDVFLQYAISRSHEKRWLSEFDLDARRKNSSRYKNHMGGKKDDITIMVAVVGHRL